MTRRSSSRRQTSLPKFLASMSWVAMMASVARNGRRVTVARAFSVPTTASRPLFGVSKTTATSSRLFSTAAPEAPAKEQVVVEHPSYEIVDTDFVSEYGSQCVLYRHKRSGAELLSVSSDDDNKVFGVTFRTPPDDSTGVPHILEHSVLCGSRKYKTKDPFVQLLQGSLQTFLNAFTYPDRTCYVVASQNTKDFYNLINVYADAVFHPRAISDPMVHAQEGWHLELEKKDDPLIYKGVVYNEMKGVYSQPDSLLYRAAQRSLFPDNTYTVDSGGDPKVIPELSFQQFADFHAKFYHPSNSRIYFSGDDDVSTRLNIMDEYLHEFDFSPESKPASVVQWQPKKFSEPIREQHTYPISADQPETHMLMVNWLMHDQPLTPVQELTVGILDHLLMGTSSSVLRKSLLESGLGADITGGGISDELLQTTFSVGLKGVEKDNVGKVEQLVLDTLKSVVDNGFEDDDIASSMNTIEFRLREFNTGSFPKGLSFMLASMSKWLYDESPTDGLKFEEPLAELKAAIAESGSKVFQDMVKEMLVDNTHRTTVELVPSRTMEAETLKEEQDRLADIKSKLSDEELDKIIQTTQELKALQAAEDSPEDRSTIPSLELKDLKREITEYPIAVSKNEKDSGITVIRHELGSTSGIAYVNMGIDLSVLPFEDVPLLPLFTSVLQEVGAGEYDRVQLSRRIGTHTGGIRADTLTTGVVPNGSKPGAAIAGDHLQTKLMIKGKATTEKVGELFSLMKLMLTEADIAGSKSRVIELLKERKSRLESMIAGSGHSVVNTRMKARYRVGGYIDEIMGGISQLETVRELLKQAEDDWPTVQARLEGIRTKILTNSACRDGMFVDITGDAAVLDAVQPELEKLLDTLPGEANGEKLIDFYSDVHPWVAPARERMKTLDADEGFVVPTQVSYVGKAGMVYEAGETINGAAQVVSRFLRTGYLWDRVRVMGGAYGGFCTFSPYTGFFSYLSYRDPNLAKTLEVYDGAADAVVAAAEQLANDPEALATAIIGTIGDMDGAKSPDQKGYTALSRWLINESPEYRQQFRDEVLNTTAEDFKTFGERLKNLSNPTVAVVSSEAAFEEASKSDVKLNLKTVF